MKSNTWLYLLLVVIICAEGCKCIDLTGYSYKVLSLKINDNEELSNFRYPHRLNLWDNHEMFPGKKKIALLKKKGYSTGLPIKFPDWEMGKNNCKLIITDTLQNIFSGSYEIIEVTHAPMRFLLKSDSIEILIERLIFTIEKPYMDVPLFDTTEN